jgi:Putative bacterial sensory transduction regulator
VTTQVTTDLSAIIEDFLGERELTYSRKDSGGKDADYFVIELPGEKKLKTTVLLTVGPHGLRLEAFVCRKPDENHEGVYKWMLKRNRRLYGVAYTLDNAGDIYLVGRHSAESITGAELDRLLGQTLEAADGDFNVLLEIGFITSIRREWAWRESRGESLNNLKAFEHLIEGHEPGGTRPNGWGAGRADGAGAPLAGGGRAESVVQNGVAPRDVGDDEDDVSDSPKA